MFSDFERPRGSLFRTEVNSLIGILFLGTCALWAAMLMWNVTMGHNPISQGIAAAAEKQIVLPDF